MFSLDDDVGHGELVVFLPIISSSLLPPFPLFFFPLGDKGEPAERSRVMLRGLFRGFSGRRDRCEPPLSSSPPSLFFSFSLPPFRMSEGGAKGEQLTIGRQPPGAVALYLRSFSFPLSSFSLFSSFPSRE